MSIESPRLDNVMPPKIDNNWSGDFLCHNERYVEITFVYTRNYCRFIIFREMKENFISSVRRHFTWNLFTFELNRKMRNASSQSKMKYLIRRNIPLRFANKQMDANDGFAHRTQTRKNKCNCISLFAHSVFHAIVIGNRIPFRIVIFAVTQPRMTHSATTNSKTHSNSSRSNRWQCD